MTEEEKSTPKEEEKLDIEDIKGSEDLDIEEAVAEPAEPEEKIPEIEPKEVEKEKEPVPVEEKIEDDKDVLEKAVTNTKTEVKEEKTLEKEKKTKKSKWKIALIVIVTVLMTVAVVLGLIYWLTVKNQTKSEDIKTEEPKVEEPKTDDTAVLSDKSVYVNATDGLRLRKEPNPNAEILDTMPFGTKLTPLETSGDWIKVEYNGKTGWCMSTYTSAVNPLIYKNTDYGFEITFPSTWSGYKLFKKVMTDGSIVYYVAIPTTDKSWPESSADAGYASLFTIDVYTKAQWQALQAEEGIKPTKLGEKGDYVYAWSSGQATPTDATARFAEIKSIIATFKIV